jgi:hypothetical protein
LFFFFVFLETIVHSSFGVVKNWLVIRRNHTGHLI